MFFDVTAASSLLALFVSTGTTCNQLHNLPTTSNPSPLSERIPTPKTRAFRLPPLHSSKLIPRSVKLEKYASFLEWLRASGATVHESLEIDKSSSAGYGAFLLQDVQEGELLFSIPRNLCVTIEKATSSNDDDGTFGDGLSTIVEKAGPGGSTVAMAGYLAKEYILMVLERRDPSKATKSNSDSFWGPYMELLPWKRGINNQEHVLFWNDRKIEELLRGSMCYSEAKNLREEVALSITVLGPLLKRSVRMARGDLSTDPLERFKSMLPWEQFQNDNEDLNEILDDKLIGDAIKGAFVTLLTRSFADDSDETDSTDADDADDDDDDDEYSEKLVPLLDLLQHSDAPNVRHSVVGEAVEVRARIPIPAGSELYNQYRSEEEESMPYSRFFTRFGFVPGIDEPIENLLLDKSPIFYPQTAEV